VDALHTVRSLAAARYYAATFLVALLLLLAAAPFLEESTAGELVQSVLLSTVLLTAVGAVGGNRRTVLTATFLAIPTLAGKWLHVLRPGAVRHEWFLIAAIAFAVFVISHHLRHILRAPMVDVQVICAGVSTFLMLGLLWTFAYLLLVSFIPEAMTMEVVPGTRRPLGEFGAVYFSFSTLTGGSCPEVAVTSNGARMLVLFEGMTGMFYVAILIARLVALYSQSAAIKQNP